jgi:hypothetical protein
LINSWTADCDREGCLCVRGECLELKFSAKLDRWLALLLLGLACVAGTSMGVWSAISMVLDRTRWVKKEDALSVHSTTPLLPAKTRQAWHVIARNCNVKRNRDLIDSLRWARAV